jgi:UDPglucose 6-dehydrogenase
MKITVIGTGYVGLVTGACFAEMGNTVTCVDVNETRIENLKKGIIPIYEPGLDAMVQANVEGERLSFTTKLSSALGADVCFISVGTPMDEDGSADLSYVIAVADEIGAHMVKPLIVVDKSTVPVGTAQLVKEHIQAQLDLRELSDLSFEVVSNPEFLKEGTAVSDCMKPERVIIGADSEKALDTMRRLYKPYVMATDRFITMDIKSAEMTKYAANAMLATKISFINEIAGICEKVGADVNKVRVGIGSDSRIGYNFIFPGCGYGGSCFPKDVQALIKTAETAGHDATLLKSVEAVNYEQKQVLSEKIKLRFGKDLNGRIFAVWGVSFKPETDDCRESPAIAVIKALIEAGATVKAYDPKAMAVAQAEYFAGETAVTFCKNKYSAASGADALVLATEWKEFRMPDFYELQQRLLAPVIFDGRNQYDAKNLIEMGFEYYQIGVRNDIIKV